MVTRRRIWNALRFAFGLVIFLAKGAFKSKDAPYVVPMSVITGLITGMLLANFAF
jgi:hypothetical protein